MGDYTKLNDDMAHSILQLYGIENYVSLRPLSLGISNSNYRVQTQDHVYLLKVSNDKSFEDLNNEQILLGKLKELNYPLSLQCYKTLKGELVYQYKNLYGVLFPFIKGIPPGPSDQTCREIGYALGLLHDKTKNVSKGDIRDYSDIGHDASSIAKFTQEPSCPNDFKNAFDLMLANKLDQYLKANKSYSIIHGDLYYDNTLFQEEKVAAMLDFEQAGYGEVILDLGISISGSCIEKGQINPDLVKSYLEGYEKTFRLNNEEKLFINEAILLGLFSIALWRIKRFKEGDLNARLENSYQDLIAKAHNYFELINKE